jgi:hypothetical protein
MMGNCQEARGGIFGEGPRPGSKFLAGHASREV